MSDLSRKVEYLKGLADGMNLKEDKQDQRFLLKILEVLEDMAEEIEELVEVQDEMNEYLENMDEDLAMLEDAVFEDDGAPGEGDDEDDELDGDSIIEYECPHCGSKTRFDITDFDFDEDYLCPQCQQPFFPEIEEEDSDDDEDEPQPER
ncbi:MAG TPA: primase-helicase zinc-binding domain-containing protein [Clostridia bacterium]|nr:primase-helicase zinc-binding domain-containing protein [Clostridia bacterium]